jgi:hypothetical protein
MPCPLGLANQLVPLDGTQESLMNTKALARSIMIVVDTIDNYTTIHEFFIELEVEYRNSFAYLLEILAEKEELRMRLLRRECELAYTGDLS